MSYLVVRSPSAEQKRMMKRPPPCNQHPPKSILIKNEKRASVHHAGLSSGTSTSGSYSTPHLNYNSTGTTPETANTTRSASLWRHGKGVNRFQKNDWDTFMKQSNSNIVQQLEGRPPRAQNSEATDKGDTQPPVPVVGSRVPSMSTSNDDWDKNCGVGKQKKKTNRQQEQEKEQHSVDSLRVSDEDSSTMYGAPFAADKSASTSTGGSSTTLTIQYDDSSSMLSEGIIIRSPYSCATTRCNSLTQKKGGGGGGQQRQPHPQRKQSHCYHDQRLVAATTANAKQQQDPNASIAFGDRVFSCFSPKNDTIDYDEILQSRSPTTDDYGYDQNNKKKNLPPMSEDGNDALDVACDTVEDIVCSAKTTPSLKQTASGALLLQSQRHQQQRQRYAVDEKILPSLNKKEIYVLVEEEEEEDNEEDNENEPEGRGGDDHVTAQRIPPNTTRSEPTPTMSNKRSNNDNFEQRRTMNDLTNSHAFNNDQQQIIIAPASSFQRKDCLDHAFEWTTNNATNDPSYYDQHSMKQKDVLDNVCGGVDDVACHDEEDFDDGVVLADMQHVNSTSSRQDHLPNDRMMAHAAGTHHVSTAVGKQYGADGDPLDYVFGNFEKALCVETNRNLNQYPKHDMLDNVCQPMDDALCQTDKEIIGAELNTFVKLHSISENSTVNEDRSVEDNKAENIENLEDNTCDDEMEESNSLLEVSPESLSIEKQTICSPLGRAIGNPKDVTEKEHDEEVETIYRCDCGESNFWYSRGTVDLVFDGFEEQVRNSGLKKSLYDEFQENLKRNEKRKFPSKANKQNSAAVKFQNMYIHKQKSRRGLFQRMINKGKSKARFLANTQASF